MHPSSRMAAFCKLRLVCGQLGSSRDLAHPYFSIGGRSSVTTVSLPVNRLPASRSPDRFGETQERRFRAFFQIGEVPKADTHQTESLPGIGGHFAQESESEPAACAAASTCAGGCDWEWGVVRQSDQTKTGPTTGISRGYRARR